jgi:putative ABC transport system permease protein
MRTSFLFKEVRRFFRSSPLLSISGVLVLSLSLAVCLLALTMKAALSSMAYPGMRSQAYATVAEQTDGGGSMPISWDTVERVHAAVQQQGIGLAAYSKPIAATLQTSPAGQPIRGNLAAISGGFFGAYTGPLLAGRGFTPEEIEQPQSGRRAVILSDALAVRWFGSPGNALHRFVWLDTRPFTVVGVAPQKFQGLFGQTTDAWVPASSIIPLMIDPHLEHLDPNVWKQVAAFYALAGDDHLRGVELLAAVQRALPSASAVAAPLHVSPGVTTDPVRDETVRKWLTLTLVLAVIFLAISSLNYSLLLLARTPRYAQEVRLKKALGAQSARLLAELMIGPAAMIVLALAAGLLLACGALVLSAHLPATYGQLIANPWPLIARAFLLQLPLVVGLTSLIALLPAIHMLREDGAPRLGHTTTAARNAGVWLQTIVVFQIALCIGTWILAGMIAAALLGFMQQPLGYTPDPLTVVALAPGPNGVTFTIGPGKTFPSAAAIATLSEQVRALPGVRSVTLASSAPLEPMETAAVQPMDRAAGAPRTVKQITVTPEYLRTIGAKLVRGRDFHAQPITGNEDAILINQSLAKELWPDADPLHRSVKLIQPAFAGMPSFSTVTAVRGVVQDMQMGGPGGSPEPTVFMLLAGGDGTPQLIVNGSESIHALETLVSRQVPILMPGLRVSSVYRLRDRQQSLLRPEKNRALFAMAGALTMAIAAYVGLFGALVYFVRIRRREFAVRICFGATPWRIRRTILARAAVSASLGALLSLPLWVLLSRLSLQGYLGQVSWSTGRSVVIALVCVVLSVVIAAAPGSQAVHISPSEVLKEE